MNSEKIIEWLNAHSLIKIKALEEVCELPADTIRHALKGRRTLSEKHAESIILELKKYGYR